MSSLLTTIPEYKVKQGPLDETYGLFVPGTHNTGAQISAARIADPGLQSKGFFVSNVPMATKRDGKVLLGIGLTPAAFDIVFGQQTQRVCQELVSSGYIALSETQRELIRMQEEKGDVVFVDPAEMKLSGKDDTYRSFGVETNNFSKDIYVARMPFVMAGYGFGAKLTEVMAFLKRNNIPQTTLYTMNPEHVADHLTDGEIVARAAVLDIFGYNSNFDADIGNVNSRNSLRGVLSSAAGGGAQRTPLETLVGKGRIAHGNIAVVRKDDVAGDDWTLLTEGP